MMMKTPKMQKPMMFVMTRKRLQSLMPKYSARPRKHFSVPSLGTERSGFSHSILLWFRSNLKIVLYNNTIIWWSKRSLYQRFSNCILQYEYNVIKFVASFISSVLKYVFKFIRFKVLKSVVNINSQWKISLLILNWIKQKLQ